MKQIPLENFLKMSPQVPQYSQKNQHYLISGTYPVSYLDDGTQEEQIAPLSASIDWLSITPSLIDKYPESNQDYVLDAYAGSTRLYGQSFLNVNATYLKSCKFYIKKNGTPTGNIFAYIYASTGTLGTTSKPTGASLATSDSIDISTLTGSLQLITFKFSGVNQIQLSANTNYILVIGSNNGDGTNNLEIGFDSSSPSYNGNVSSSSDGTNWTATSVIDMIFYIFGGSLTSGNVPIEGNIVHMIPSTEGTYSSYAITDTTKVYGVSYNSVVDLGYPTGSSTNSNGGYMAIGGGTTGNLGYLFVTLASSSTAVYYMPLPGGSWSTYAGANLVTSTGVHILEPFLDFIAVKDGRTAYLQGSIVRKLDVSALTIPALPVVGLDLGTGFSIIQMRNFNNKYLAIAGGKTSSGGLANGYAQNYIFLWDGVSSRYNYSLKVPGQFIDMRVVDSVLYVAVRVSNGKTIIYYLNGTKLTKIFTTQISTVYNSAVIATPSPFFDFKNYLGIILNPNSDLQYPLMIYGRDEIGDMEFIHSSGRRFEIVCPGYDGNIFASQYVVSGFSTLYYLPTSGTYQQILYKSQWMPVKNLKFIDIYYDTPPVGGTDAINVTIDGQGEDIIAGSVTISLASITSTNYLTKKRSRLDVQGFTGDQLRITLSTINSTWQPKIRAIVPIVK